MSRWQDPARRYALGTVLALLPVFLLLSAWLGWREFAEIRTLYLRHQAASIAGRLETLPPAGVESLVEEESALLAARVLRPDGSPESSAVDAIWRGEELYRVEELGDVFRVYAPFHESGELRIARLDLDARAADDLLRHARHNVLIAMLSAGALVLLSVYALRSSRQHAVLEKRQLEMAHLARLGEMAAMLAHEIRNPLGAIKGFAQLALEKAPDLSPYLQPIPENAERLEKLVTDLLCYARVPQPEIETVAWRDLAEGLSVNLEGAPELELRTDKRMLRHVLENLVQNATQAMANEDWPIVDMRAIREGADAVITVSDSGPTVSEEQLQRMGEPFFTTKATGTGLGLAIVRKFVTAMGGQVVMRRRVPRGLEVEVRLPQWEVRV